MRQILQMYLLGSVHVMNSILWYLTEFCWLLVIASVLSLEIWIASDFDKVAGQQSIISSIIICNFKELFGK